MTLFFNAFCLSTILCLTHPNPRFSFSVRISLWSSQILCLGKECDWHILTYIYTPVTQKVMGDCVWTKMLLYSSLSDIDYQDYVIYHVDTHKPWFSAEMKCTRDLFLELNEPEVNCYTNLSKTFSCKPRVFKLDSWNTPVVRAAASQRSWVYCLSGLVFLKKHLSISINKLEATSLAHAANFNKLLLLFYFFLQPSTTKKQSCIAPGFQKWQLEHHVHLFI